MKLSRSWHVCVFLPLLMLWQGSSCHSTKSNTNNVNQNQNTKGAISGSWGGPDIALEVTSEGVNIEFDCAHGHIDKAIVPDADGKFSVNGKYVQEHGGPVRTGEDAGSRAAVYQGRIAGEKMNLTVTFPDGTQEVGPFNLERGKSGRIHKCM